ncbi:hypothetical protein C7999DRAFT_43242 [Corynascus novoguineensis]|uniref:Uncharacterized protein n=1 Tax=Corynascus novoguineensis TaxID=1126955 RepID=A0AAN7CP30_9PEZI|nr:hypothetical protein C7999DRAFT_43242 [Corynascus novoguineensis]
MELLDRTSDTPTRIPRPTFPAASPRTPSIRAVPNNPKDHVAIAFKMTESYSPSSWLSRKASKSASLHLAIADDQSRNGQETDLNTTNQNGSTTLQHQATFLGVSGATIIGSHSMAQGRISTTHRHAAHSLDSVEARTCAPKHGDSNEQANSAGARYPQPMTEVPERPMTPTPYSMPRKVSEVSEPVTSENADDNSSADLESPAFVSQHQGTAQRHPAMHHIPQRPANDSLCARPQDTTHEASLAPVSADEGGRVILPPYPLFRAGLPRGEHRRADPFAAPGNSPTQPGYGGSNEGPVAHNKPEGIVVLKLPGAVGSAHSIPSPPTTNDSIYSRRPTTLQSEAPDLKSLRLGPRLRHSRLPMSPSLVLNAGRGVPEGTKKLWIAVGQSRKLMLASAVFLEFSILNVVASITAVTASHIEHGHAAIRLAVWAAVSGVFVLTSGALLGVALLRYRKTNEDLVSGEGWIEMHLRSRPLPPRPQREERNQENGATKAWKKFSQDRDQLRRYVEFLESRIGVLEEGRQDVGQQQHERSYTHINGGVNDASACDKIDMDQDLSSHTANSDGSTGNRTLRPTKLDLGGSLSRRRLLQPDSSTTELVTSEAGDVKSTIPESDTKASILTELCEAVTEGYSPLSEQYPEPTPAAVHRRPENLGDNPRNANEGI